MNKYLSLFFAVLCVSLFSCEKPAEENGPDNNNGKESVLKVECRTLDASEIDYSSAIFSGSATIENAKVSTIESSFYYSDSFSTSKELCEKGISISTGSIDSHGGSFSTKTTNLKSETRYYYVAAVKVGNEEYYGEVKSFSTTAPPKEPTKTGEASNITCISASLSGFANPTPEMGNVTMGIIYSTESSPTVDNGTKLNAVELDNNNMYTVQANNLSSETTYYYKSFILANGVMRSGETKKFTTTNVPATVSSMPVTDVTEFKATLNGLVTLDSSVELSKEVWFIYSDSADTKDELISKGKRVNSECDADGNFNSKLESLQYGAPYYYIACAKVHDTLFYGEVISFKACEIKASVSTLDAVDISEQKASIRGSLTVESIESIETQVWFLYSDTNNTVEQLLSAGTKVSASQDNDVYSARLSNLSYNRQYFYVVVARVYDREIIGEVKSFTTHDIEAQVTTEDVTNITEFKATMNGTLNINTIEQFNCSVWFLYDKDASTVEQLKTVGTKAQSQLSNGAFSSSLTGLKHNTHYYYVAVARVYDKDFYGEVKQFSTDNYTVSFSAQDASSIGFFSATMNATLQIESKENLSKSVWFLYSDSNSTTEQLLSSGTKKSASNNGTAYSAELTKLAYNTPYYYMAVAKVNNEEFYSDVVSFQTVDIAPEFQVEATPDVWSAVINGALVFGSQESINKSVKIYYSERYSTQEDLIKNGRSVDVSIDGNSFSTKLSRLVFTTSYHYLIYAYVNGQKYYSNIKEFKTKDCPEVVDLGLSVKWRGWNVGANKPEEAGGYYAWGETETKNNYSWSTYKYCMGNSNTLTKYCSNSGSGYNGYTDDYSQLEPEDDVAIQKLGSGWRMPIFEDWKELVQNCERETSVTINGVKGWLFRSKIEGYTDNAIFLPITGIYIDDSIQFPEYGYYWSSSKNTISSNAYDAPCYQVGGYSSYTANPRSRGHNVRAVKQ